MKVLIIHQHFKTPSEGGPIRSYYLAKALLDHGHQVAVITGSNAANYERTSYEDIDVHYLPVPYDNRFGFWKRGQSFLRFARNASKHAQSLSGVDLCYAISVPLTVGLTAQWLKRRMRLPYLFEVGDLWPDAPIQLGYIANPFLQKLLFGLERSSYEKANSVIALSTAIASAIQRKVPSKPVYLIPNMADTDYYTHKPKDHSLLHKYGLKGGFIVSYIGAVGVANGLEEFVDCAVASQQAGLSIQFVICGEGALLDEHKERVRRFNLGNFRFIPFQDRKGVREIMNVTDSVFICYKPYKILETGSPNKYFDGLAAGKLILINFGGWIEEEIVRERCGVRIKMDPCNFVDVIIPFLEDDALLKTYQDSARALAESKYSRKVLGDRFATILENFRNG